MHLLERGFLRVLHYSIVLSMGVITNGENAIISIESRKPIRSTAKKEDTNVATATYMNVLREDATNTVTTHQGGQAYLADEFTRLKRFLILGSEGGSFYVSERQLTVENVKVVNECLKIDPIKTIDLIVEVSKGGKAPKNDPALLALAYAASYKGERQAQVRGYALSKLPDVARIGTHLFHFIAFVQELRGYGSGLTKALSNWYTSKDPKALAYEVIKYKQRDGFSHRDVLRLCHAKPTNEDYNTVFRYVVKGERPNTPDASSPLAIIDAAEFLSDPNANVPQLIRDFNLPREVVPTNLLTQPEIWDALLNDGKMPLEAMIRNLGTMTKVGLLTPFSDATKIVLRRLEDQAALRKSRIHPLKVLAAMQTYGAGGGYRSNATWTTVTSIVGALDAAFYKTFDNVEPSGVNNLVALDVSGSMMGGEVGGVPGLTPRDASAALALITISTEPYTEVVGFSHQLIQLPIRKGMTLHEAIRVVSNLPFGGTDCRLPMTYALARQLPVDAFTVYTDSETGYASPAATLRAYREKSGRGNASLCVVGMVANQFTLADPKDSRMLDVVGFDTSTPQIISDFAAGRI